jgi:hypothetical protein
MDFDMLSAIRQGSRRNYAILLLPMAAVDQLKEVLLLRAE